MKKFLMSLVLLVGSAAYAQTSGPVSDAMPTTGYLNWLYSGSLQLFYDGTNYRRLAGETWDTSMTAAPTLPSMNAFNVFYNETGGIGYRWGGNWLTDSLPVDPMAPYTISLGTFLRTDNTAAYQRWTGEMWDTAMDADPEAPFVLSLGTFYNTSSSAGTQWQGIGTHADGLVNTQAMPFTANFSYGFNGATWDRLRTITTQADAQAAATRGLVTSSFNYAYNGATFDLMRLGASNELQVTDVATRPGEDAGNDWRKIMLTERAVLQPAYTDTNVVGGAGLTVVFASYEVLAWTNICLTFYNSGANSFTDVSVESSADNSNFTGDLGFTGCDSAAAGVTCNYCISGNGNRYIRARVSSAANTSVRAWITGNK